MPDVALTADMVCIFTNGQACCTAGTSCAAPLWAGLTALVNKQAADNGLPSVGFLNPVLYMIGEGQNYASCFHDITVGDNKWNESPTEFTAVSSYDLCTGWGTPKGQPLINALTSLPGPFKPAGTMITCRYNHTATVLPNGLVLAAAGYCPSGIVTGVINRAEVYLPSTHEWVETGPLNAERQLHTATLLPFNGLVLVAGGAGYDLSNGAEQAGSGSPESLTSNILASAETYDASSQTWTTIRPMGAARCRHTATLLNAGEVLVAGGWGSSQSCLPSAELYEVYAHAWQSTGSMTQARELHTATLLLNGQVLVAGGLNAGVSLASAELFDPFYGTWTPTLHPMRVARAGHTATLLRDGMVLVTGGATPASAELYDPTTQTWTLTAYSPATTRYAHTATLLLDGLVLVAGGQDANGVVLNSAELYNPNSQSWTGTSSLNFARELHTATMLPNGFVLLAGGYSTSGPVYWAELYAP